MKKGKGQAERFILDIAKAKIMTKMLLKQCKQVHGKDYMNFVKEIVVIKGREIIYANKKNRGLPIMKTGMTSMTK